MALWWDSTLNLTLDTISVLVTQYNNTAVTRTTTIYEDVSSLNISTVTEAQSLAFSVLQPVDAEYEPNGFALNNGTNAFVDGSFSVAYPTPFIGIQGFEYISVTQQDPHCPKGLQSGDIYEDTPSGCACMMEMYMDNPDQLQYAVTSQITLSSTYYELGDRHPVNNDLHIYLEGPISINNVSYSNFIGSVLGSEGFNKYRSCAFLDVGVGPPALMIPVAALTGTTTSTVKSAGNYGVSSPYPGSPIAPIAPPTSTPAAPALAPLVSPTPDNKPRPESPTTPNVASQTTTPVPVPLVPIVNNPRPAPGSPSPPSPANSPVNEPAKAEPQGPVESPSDGSGTDQTSANEGQPAVGPSDSSKNGQSNTGAQPVAGSSLDSDNNEGSSPDDTKPAPLPGVVISYAGSSLTPDTSSYYNIPQIGKLSPGGSPVTINNIVYSLASSAAALVSNGQTIVPPTIAAAVPYTMKQAAAPALKFGGSTYTADSLSRIIIAGQTVVPGASAIMVSSTPISLAYGAYMAVVGGTTQSLYSAVPTAYPQIEFEGETYTANKVSAFVIAGQTLSPGGFITVSSTPISLAAGAAFAVLAGSTQSLALAPAPTEPPTFTFNGSTFTAGSGSEFLIGSQTLTEGGVVTVAGTPISYASNGGDVVVGTSTEAVNIGGLIMGGFGNGGMSTTGPVQFTGAAIGYKGGLPWWLLSASLGVALLAGLLCLP